MSNLSESKTKLVVMVVDDDVVMLNTIFSILKNDYAVRPFRAPREAMAYAQEQGVDLVLLDSKMPEMSGYEFLAELHSFRSTKDVPVIFLAGASSEDVEAEALSRGAADCLLKPVNAQVLLVRVRMQCDLLEYRQQVERKVRERTAEVRLMCNKLRDREALVLMLLARVTDLRDSDTGNHIRRTKEFTELIVRDLLANPQSNYQLDPAEAENIISSSTLHDIGKIGTPDAILCKEGPLTDEEREMIKQHPVYAYNLLSEFLEEDKTANDFLRTAREIAYGHHEQWSGKGYPRQLVGANTPLSARIVAIADVYDALTSSRPYKKPMPHEKASSIIIEGGGAHFDPYLVEIFKRHHERFAHIAETIR